MAKINISNSFARNVMKKVHYQRINKIHEYYRTKSEKYEKDFQNKANAKKEEMQEKLTEIAKEMDEILKLFNISGNFPAYWSYDGKSANEPKSVGYPFDMEHPKSVELKLTEKSSISARHNYVCSKKFEEEYNKDIEDENNAYEDTLLLLKGVRDKARIIEVVSVSYDLDLEKYEDEEKEKPAMKKHKFNKKKFCETKI